MTHLLADHDSVGDSVAWCSDDTAWQCSEDVDEVDCALDRYARRRLEPYSLYILLIVYRPRASATACDNDNNNHYDQPWGGGRGQSSSARWSPGETGR